MDKGKNQGGGNGSKVSIIITNFMNMSKFRVSYQKSINNRIVYS